MMIDVIPTFLRVNPGGPRSVLGIIRWQHGARVTLVGGLNLNISRHELIDDHDHL